MSNSSAGDATPKKRGCGFWVMVLLGSLVGLAILGSIFGPSKEEMAAIEAKEEASRTAAAKAQREAAIKVSAVQLFRAYQANEARAQRDYGGNLLEVTGTVDGVALDFSDEPFVTLVTDNQFMSAQAELTKAAQAASADLSKGQKITLLCQGVSELAGRPMLKECDIL